MSHLRNVALSLLTLGCLASASYAGDLSGKFTATYLGPTNQTADGAPLACPFTALCTMVRKGLDPPIPPGQSRVATIVATNVDGVSVHIELGIWIASGCTPDPTTPDSSGAGDLVLPMAGRYILSFRTEDLLVAGTTFSQKWAVSTTDMSIDCGAGFCVNSLAGNPGMAPADCDQP